MKFKCLRCVHCCFFVTPNEFPVVLEPEVKKLNELAKKFNVKLEFRYLGNGFYLWVINGYCPFYDVKTASCLIHEEKPLSCKMYPLLLNIHTGEVSASLLCDWVMSNLDNIKGLSPKEVFPDEFNAILKLVNMIKELRS